jgi:hypothetical protein
MKRCVTNTPQLFSGCERQDDFVTAPAIRPFGTRALYAALDARRSELGLSWKAVADQLWELSSELNSQRNDHPISPSTLTGMAKNPTCCDVRLRRQVVKHGIRKCWSEVR